MSEPVKIVVIVEGGVIQWVFTMGVPVQVCVIDYDTEGADPSELVTVPTDTGGEQQGYVSTYAAAQAPADLVRFADSIGWED